MTPLGGKSSSDSSFHSRPTPPKMQKVMASAGPGSHAPPNGAMANMGQPMAFPELAEFLQPVQNISPPQLPGMPYGQVQTQQPLYPQFLPVYQQPVGLGANILGHFQPTNPSGCRIQPATMGKPFPSVHQFIDPAYANPGRQQNFGQPTAVLPNHPSHLGLAFLGGNFNNTTLQAAQDRYWALEMRHVPPGLPNSNLRRNVLHNVIFLIAAMEFLKDYPDSLLDIILAEIMNNAGQWNFQK